MKNRQLAWSLPKIVTNCRNVDAYPESDNVGMIDRYNTNAAALRELTKKVIGSALRVARIF